MSVGLRTLYVEHFAVLRDVTMVDYGLSFEEADKLAESLRESDPDADIQLIAVL